MDILNYSITVDIIIIVFLLLFSSFFSGSEAALFSLSLLQREKLSQSGTKSGQIIDKLLSGPRRLIVTILMGNDMVNIAASVVATYMFSALFGESGKWITLAVMTPLTLIFAEVIPKTISASHNEQMAIFVSRPLDLFAKIISPLRWTFDKFADILIRLMGVKSHGSAPPIMEDDFLEMVDLSHEDGVIKRTERDLIHNVFEFSDVLVQDVMTRLENMFCLPYDIKPNELIKAVKENHFSRIPIYRENINNIVGILYAKDLLKLDLSKTTPKSGFLQSISRRPYFVKETMKVESLFQALKQRRMHMAICLNEKGNVSGLITMEDILEELFGEIYDEYDREET